MGQATSNVASENFPEDAAAPNTASDFKLQADSPQLKATDTVADKATAHASSAELKHFLVVRCDSTTQLRSALKGSREKSLLEGPGESPPLPFTPAVVAAAPKGKKKKNGKKSSHALQSDADASFATRGVSWGDVSMREYRRQVGGSGGIPEHSSGGEWALGLSFAVVTRSATGDILEDAAAAAKQDSDSEDETSVLWGINTPSSGYRSSSGIARVVSSGTSSAKHSRSLRGTQKNGTQSGKGGAGTRSCTVPPSPSIKHLSSPLRSPMAASRALSTASTLRVDLDDSTCMTPILLTSSSTTGSDCEFTLNSSESIRMEDLSLPPPAVTAAPLKVQHEQPGSAAGSVLASKIEFGNFPFEISRAMANNLSASSLDISCATPNAASI